MEYVNKFLYLHKSEDPEQTLLLDSHCEVFDAILSCSNEEKLPHFCSSQTNDHLQKFKIWDLALSLCVVPQFLIFLRLLTGVPPIIPCKTNQWLPK